MTFPYQNMTTLQSFTHEMNVCTYLPLVPSVLSLLLVWTWNCTSILASYRLKRTFDTLCLQNRVALACWILTLTPIWFYKAGASHTYRPVATLKPGSTEIVCGMYQTKTGTTHKLHTSSQSLPCDLHSGRLHFNLLHSFCARVWWNNWPSIPH